MKITVDLDELANLTKTADGIFMDGSAEKSLVALLDLSDKLEQAVKEAKATLEAKALALDPNFQSIQGDKIKVGYRYFGSRWSVDESNLSQLPEIFYNKKTVLSVNTEVVEDQLKKTNQLPLGLRENDRTKTITITLKK